ncbi:MAG TPA: glycoside hydrolase family 20 zincin-like fold domain-containing protein, partial [Pyrinomonadaceae bacterium]|nr:glycoside hydrolase family 20 zincin-like fold domain-containing protein [Pyrinomonadaceae bacterium]
MLHTLSRRLPLRLTVAGLYLFTVAMLQVSQTQAQNSQAPFRLSVIPKPREMTVTVETFRLDRSAHITLADPHSPDDQFAAADFIADVKETTGLSLKTRHSRGRQTILIGLLSNSAIQSALKAAAFAMPATLNEEGYVLSVNKDGVIVGGANVAGTFYGLQTLKQLVRGESTNAFIPGVRITDWPALRWRGVSDDISRGPVP